MISYLVFVGLALVLLIVLFGNIPERISHRPTDDWTNPANTLTTLRSGESRSLLGLSAVGIPRGLGLSAMDVIGKPFDREFETPVLWKLSKTGSSVSVQPYLSDCLNLITASEVGATVSSYRDSSLGVVQLSNERRYVNVDTTTTAGLSQAKVKMLPQSGLADVIISPLLKDVTDIFDATYRVRLFTIMAHPIQRSVSTFFQLQVRLT